MKPPAPGAQKEYAPLTYDGRQPFEEPKPAPPAAAPQVKLDGQDDAKAVPVLTPHGGGCPCATCSKALWDEIYGLGYKAALAEADRRVSAAVQAEREACIKVVAVYIDYTRIDDVKAAIRARAANDGRNNGR
jgi:hypothetical protein